jgi:DNA replication and repair protein RecF
MQVRPDWHNVRLETIREGMAAALSGLRSEEIARGQSLIGPHRDEIGYESNGIDLRRYGSRGQNRTAMLSFKLAQIDWTFQRTQKRPILLLDEVMAELDQSRRVKLMQSVTAARQSILTTADLETFNDEFHQCATTWRIEAGQLKKMDS